MNLFSFRMKSKLHEIKDRLQVHAETLSHLKIDDLHWTRMMPFLKCVKTDPVLEDIHYLDLKDEYYVEDRETIVYYFEMVATEMTLSEKMLHHQPIPNFLK